MRGCGSAWIRVIPAPVISCSKPLQRQISDGKFYLLICPKQLKEDDRAARQLAKASLSYQEIVRRNVCAQLKVLMSQECVKHLGEPRYPSPLFFVFGPPFDDFEHITVFRGIHRYIVHRPFASPGFGPSSSNMLR